MPIANTYKKTVRCGYCHKPGHNKSSCPDYAARIEDLRQTYGNDYYVVAQYDFKKAKRKASGKTRRCSYCSETGHNRKTCSILKDHMATTRAKNVAYRKEIFQAMVKHGIFTGAIVESDTNTRGEAGSSKRWRVPQVITRVMWSNINIWETEFRYYSQDVRSRAPLKCKPLSDITVRWENELGFPLDYDLLWNKMTTDQFRAYSGSTDDSGWYSRFKDTYFITVTSRVSAEKPPLGWLTCEDAESQKTLKEFYKSRLHSQAYLGMTKEMTAAELKATMRHQPETL